MAFERAIRFRAARLCLVLTMLVGLMGTSLYLHGQAQRTPVPSSDLARQNLAHVAASVGQLVAVLHRDPGLMVELKRWIAKDATDHGQLISDADLADEAILQRLETDISFRSVATVLVQKYGYLQPTINPDSELGKEQELLMQERVMLLAQRGAPQPAKTQQSQAQQAGQLCDPRTGTCTNGSGLSQTPSQRQSPPGMPGLQTPQNPSTTPSLPAPQQTPTMDVPQLLRTSGQANSGTDLVQDSQNGAPAAVSGEDVGFSGLGQLSGQSSPRSAANSGGGGSQIEDISLSADFGGERPGRDPTADLYASNIPNSAGSSSFAEGSNDLEGLPRSGVTDLNAAHEGSRTKDLSRVSPRMVRRPNPYNDIPSLFDMYLQATPRPAALERFGMQIFQNGSRDLQAIPMDLPVGPEYVLGPGDSIAIDLWGGVSRRFYEVVDREGRISLPEAGPELVAGKSLADVQQSVQKILRTQFRDVSADVSLARLRTIRVYVVGDVERPGAYDIGSLSTPLNALFAAGGPTDRGSLRIVKHFRGNNLVQDVDVYDLLLHGVKGNLQRLENGDTVLVPPLGAEITLEGMVRRPGIYEQRDEQSLADALALAGGLLPAATLRHIEVQRLVVHEKQTMLSLDIPPDVSSQVTQQLEAFHIQDGDKIRIFPIAAYAQDAVYLEGHVLRPGKYSYRDGMRVTDLIASYTDLLPEPDSNYGEIIRLSAPDFRPTVESFDLAKAMSDPAGAPLLQRLDTVQIFSRYDFENPPVVSVLGDVRDPGTFRTSGDIHISDAIHLAGGLTPDAETLDAQVFRHMPDSSLKILNVKLDSALQGNPSDNIVLHPRDRVLVHGNVAASDPATVYVKGEVARPGRYPLTADMKVSDLILAAGGLKQSADTQSADLTHYLWKDDKQVTGQEQQIVLADALTGDSNGDSNKKDQLLNNGDVLSIRQVPGWDDLGASITVRGEVVHPGSYGIRPGERLSSVLQRAGGFAPGAYPYGAVLMRTEVQKLEQRSYGELVQRVREQQASLKLTASSAAADPDQKLSAEAAFTQWQTALDDLVNNPPTGRVTIQISSNVRSWEDSIRDITVRPGDILVIPKRPSFVLVQGQVYGPTAVAFRPGKSATWYLMQAGGPTNMANKKSTFVIRADGTVIGNHGSFWNSGDGLSAALRPGDTVVVPEKALGGPPVWKNLFQNAQVLSSIATSAVLASIYF